ncbi:MAG: HD domain-containing phosphohydrolase [Fodinibius sp.]|nr:HD domain-containing phosphohydrolase [Fodinibius sp.]
MSEVTNYVQTIAKRLGSAFSLEAFEIEKELEFWALGAEYLSRDNMPEFKDIVQWVDIVYTAPVHFVYMKEDENTLKLFHRRVISDNLESKFSLGTLSESNRKEKVTEFEQELDNLKNKIRETEDMKEMGGIAFPIGHCQKIPFFKDGDFRGIYCVGPYAESPELIRPRISIIGRILSGWLVEEFNAKQRTYKTAADVTFKKTDEDATGPSITQFADVLLSYCVKNKGANFAALVDMQRMPEVLAQSGVRDSEVKQIEQEFGGSVNQPQEVASFLKRILSQREDSADNIIIDKLLENQNVFLVLGLTEDLADQYRNSDMFSSIVKTTTQLFHYRDQHTRMTVQIIDTYYQMIRQLEQKRDKTAHHTNRVIALSKEFANHFGMDEREKESISTAAKLHDIGYISVSTEKKRSIGSDLDHPRMGYEMIKSLAIDQEIKEGVRTHHEWVDGSGTPAGISGGDIPWTGKVIGLVEFLAQFIENHKDDDSKSSEEWIEELSSSLIERADVQFDMVLIRSAVQMINKLGWQDISKLGEDS